MINLKYAISNNILITALISQYLTKFWEDIMNKLDSKQYILFFFRVEFEYGDYAMLTKGQILNKHDYKGLLEILTLTLEFKSY